MKYRVFRQGSKAEPRVSPRLDEPWIFTGEVEAEEWVDAIIKGADNEKPDNGRIWYIAIALDGEHGDANPEYWQDKGGTVHGKYVRREW